MASRERKISLGKKQSTASPVRTKDADTGNQEVVTATSEEAPKLTPIKNSKLNRKLKRPVTKKIIQKNLKINFKTNTKRGRPKGAKNILTSVKGLELKKALIKNGVKKTIAKKVSGSKLEDEGPPVLEPMLPVEEEKKIKKKPIIKKEEDATSDVSEVSSKGTPKSKGSKKPKVDTAAETIEDVINDLKSLIKSEEHTEEQIKTEVKKKTSGRKSRLELIKRKAINKKENIKNVLNKIVSSDSKIIDLLDLNVGKIEKVPRKIRRHSIEKFALEKNEFSKVPNISIFNNLPRSISPRTKRASKLRKSIDTIKRCSPYTTRSDSPARILRNGKHRKLNFNLVNGLDVHCRKRRRLCSEYSGSEVSVSKLSGYESDSSFSDLSSLPGADIAEKDCDALKSDIKKEIQDSSNTDQQEPVNIQVPAIKRSLSTENILNSTLENNQTDTNSNLFMDVVPNESKVDQKVINPLYNLALNDSENSNEKYCGSSSSKVPEKSIILDNMKQAFNETCSTEDSENDKRSTRKSVVRKNSKTFEEMPQNIPTLIFYNKSENTQNNIELKQPKEVISKEAEFEVKAHLEPEAEKNLSEEKIVSENELNLDDAMPSTDENIILQLNNEQEHSNESTENQEDLVVKEHILQALGLQSLKAAEEAKQRLKETTRCDAYTGTLKTVIKLNRLEKKKGRNSVKMTLQKSKKVGGTSKDQDDTKIDDYKIAKEGATNNWKSGTQSSDTAGALRKSHYSNRSNMDGSSEHTSDGDTNGVEEGSGKVLVIPEKASSFSIHPDRLCKDECSHCFGKFGLFDTPCHIAQIKAVEKQDKILETEKHLTRDSCLCDACYRHVDRKSNTPSYARRAYKRSTLVGPGPKQNHCHVLNCRQEATNILRRKWIIKMKKNITDMMNIDLDNPGLHSIPICDQHYSELEHLMVCAMCKRRLARNHIHYLGPESTDLNTILNNMGIPVKLGDKPIVCKLCRYFASIAPKNQEDQSETEFVNEYKKRLLHFHDVEPMDKAEAEEPIPVPTRGDKDQLKKKKKLKQQSSSDIPAELEVTKQSDQNSVPSSVDSQPGSPSDYMVDYNTLIPNVALDCAHEPEAAKKEQPKKPLLMKKINRPESVKEAVEISKTLKLKNKSDIAVQRLGSNPSISVRQLFPGEEDLPLHANIDFNTIKERTPEGWEKCSTIIQYDIETKLLWQELQKPYGNQSSFLRHLILLEKYFRNGDLILSPTASNNSINYSESVQNRLKAYDNIPSNAGPTQPLTMLPFNKSQRSSSGIITSKESTPNLSMINAANIPKSTPITLTQINNSTIVSTPKQKSPGLPPGLISLHATKPTPLQKVPQPQKIKFPITKNWRPNLIPIDPNKKMDRKTGLVQVISGGKPYHITLEDYKKMCAIKRTFDLRQKRIQEATQKSQPVISPQSVLKTMVPKKGLVITKTSTIAIAKSEQNLHPEPELENSLEKLDKQVEKLELNLNDPKSVMILPKIPKSLTVIPQSIPRKTSRPTSPVLLITSKSKPSTSKS